MRLQPILVSWVIPNVLNNTKQTKKRQKSTITSIITTPG